MLTVLGELADFERGLIRAREGMLLSGRHGGLREFPPPRRNLLFHKLRKESVEMRRRVYHIGEHKRPISVVPPIGLRRTEQ